MKDTNEEKKDVTIIVNGRKKVVHGKEISFEDLVKLAFENPPSGPNVVFTVTYRKGDDDKPEGTLLPGQKVKVKDGMIFNVTATDKS
jgi:hypothetical protein